MAKMESDLESQMTAIRREHAKAIDSYVARDQAWQLEKEVIFTGVKIRDPIRQPFFSTFFAKLKKSAKLKEFLLNSSKILS